MSTRPLLPFAFALALSVHLVAQDEPPDELPPDAQRIILDLNFVVEDITRRTETEQEVRLELSSDVLFDFDSAAIKAAARPSLETAARLIRDEALGDVRVEGHTDSKGENDYNQTLSEQRAASVRDWLAADGGLDDRTFVTTGFGETQPVTPNEIDGVDDPLGRQRNRRVEIIITKIG